MGDERKSKESLYFVLLMSRFLNITVIAYILVLFSPSYNAQNIYKVQCYSTIKNYKIIFNEKLNYY